MIQKFILRFLLFVFAFIVLNSVLLFVIPKDNNDYLCEYSHKINLLETTSQPRMIFVGGSNIAFGIDSKAISDSLNINVVNFGLHGGIGIRIPLEDCLHYVHKGDIVVAQFEYGQFKGGYGEQETLPDFMVATNWKYAQKLHVNQWNFIISGSPILAVKNLKRLLKYPLSGSWNSSEINAKYAYVASGFNEYGDEVSHLNFPSEKIAISNKQTKANGAINIDFMKWLADIIHQYEQIGVEVIMLPPVCVKSYYNNVYNANFAKELEKISHPYIVEPSYMVLDDSCYFNTGYHVNNNGVLQNTSHIIKVMREHIQ